MLAFKCTPNSTKKTHHYSSLCLLLSRALHALPHHEVHACAHAVQRLQAEARRGEHGLPLVQRAPAAARTLRQDLDRKQACKRTWPFQVLVRRRLLLRNSAGMMHSRAMVMGSKTAKTHDPGE